MNNKPNHHDRVLEFLTQYMFDHPDASINDCCRALSAHGTPTTKAFVGKLRKTIKRTVVKASADLRDGKLRPTDVVSAKGLVTLRMPVPARFAAQVNHDPEAEEEARAQARAREADREREQRERETMKDLEREKARKAEAERVAEEERKALEELKARAAEAPEPVAPEPAGAPVPAFARRPRGNAATRALKRQYLNELLDNEPGADPVALMAALKSRFGGVGLDWAYVYDTCRVAREIHGLPQIPTLTSAGRAVTERLSLPEYEALAEERAVGASPEEDLAWLVRQLGDLMRAHSLERVTVSADEAGGRWSFTEKPREPRQASGEVRF